MAEFRITDEDLTGLKNKVVIVTGGSSGIGLSTVKLLLLSGSKVVVGDIQASREPVENANFTFVQTDVTVWSDLTALFHNAKEQHGRIDCVFANAGIANRADYLTIETDEKGELVEPTHVTLDVNLKSVINTGCIAVHYMKQQDEGGNLLLMGSSTGIQPLRAPDYSAAKHGVLGYGRGMARLMAVAGLPIRVNMLMPSWTTSHLVPDLDRIMAGIGYGAQDAAVVARCAAYLMGDASRQGDAVYVADGKYAEIEHAVLAPAYRRIIGEGRPSDDEILARIAAVRGAGVS